MLKIPLRRRALAISAISASLAMAVGAYSAVPQAAAASSAKCHSMTSISIATSPYEDSLLMSVGQQLGWYKQNCLNVTFKNVSYSSIMQALAAGSTNVAWYTTSGVAATYHLDKGLVYYYPWDIVAQGNALMGRPNDGLKTEAQFVKQGMSTSKAIAAVIKELHNKDVITTKDNVREELLVAALHRQGKPLSWIKETNLDAASGLAAFLRGTGDAYISGIPQRQTLIDHGYKVLLAGPDLAPAALNGFLTTKTFYKQHEQALLALQHVMFMTMRFTDKHKQQVAKYIASTYDHATGSNVTPAQFLQDYQGLELYPRTAAETAKLTLRKGSKYDWRAEWQLDNTYLYKLAHSIPSAVPTSSFLGMQFQAAYAKKYGLHETGWSKPTGSLS